MKNQHFIELTGRKDQTKNDELLMFINIEKSITVAIKRDVDAIVTTTKGCYTLKKHPILNIYQGTMNGVKVHITHKAWVGQLIYWS